MTSSSTVNVIVVRKAAKGTLAARTFLAAMLILGFGVTCSADTPSRSCHIQAAMANGTRLPNHLLADVFDGSKQIIHLTLDQDGRGEIGYLPDGRFRIQITPGSGMANLGILDVIKEKPCIYSVLLGGTAEGGGLTDGTGLSVEELRITGRNKDLFARAWVAMRQGNLELAKKDLQKLTQKCPHLARAYNMLGVIDELTNDMNGAEANLRMAVSLNPSSRVALIDLAEFLLEQRQFAAATNLLDKPSSQMDLAFVHYLRATAYTRVNRYEDAIVEAAAVHRTPHSSLAKIHLVAAYALQKQNEPLKARLEYEQYIKEHDGPNAENATQSEETLPIGSTAAAAYSMPSDRKR